MQEQQQQRRSMRMSARIGEAAAAAAAADTGKKLYCSKDSSSESDDDSGMHSLDGSDTEEEAQPQSRQPGGGNSSGKLCQAQSRSQQCKRQRGAEPSSSSSSRAGSKRRRGGGSSSAPISAALLGGGGRLLPVVEQPGGIWRVDGLAYTVSTRQLANSVPPTVPEALAAKCFPGLQQPRQRQSVQLSFTVDGEDSTLATDAANAAVTRHHDRRANGMRFGLAGAMPALRSYPSHTITGMSSSSCGTQLTLHLQSPAAVAAAQQQAEAAAAAAEAAVAVWHEHQLPIAKELPPHNGGRPCFSVPPCLLKAAFDDAWQQRGFKVLLSVHKDGDCIAGGTGARRKVTLAYGSGSAGVILPSAMRSSVHGCRLVMIKAAAPNLIQAHVSSNVIHPGGVPAAATAATANWQVASTSAAAPAAENLPANVQQGQQQLLLQGPDKVAATGTVGADIAADHAAGLSALAVAASFPPAVVAAPATAAAAAATAAAVSHSSSGDSATESEATDDADDTVADDNAAGMQQQQQPNRTAVPVLGTVPGAQHVRQCQATCAFMTPGLVAAKAAGMLAGAQLSGDTARNVEDAAPREAGLISVPDVTAAAAAAASRSAGDDGDTESVATDADAEGATYMRLQQQQLQSSQAAALPPNAVRSARIKELCQASSASLTAAVGAGRPHGSPADARLLSNPAAVDGAAPCIVVVDAAKAAVVHVACMGDEAEQQQHPSSTQQAAAAATACCMGSALASGSSRCKRNAQQQPTHVPATPSSMLAPAAKGDKPGTAAAAPPACAADGAGTGSAAAAPQTSSVADAPQARGSTEPSHAAAGTAAVSGAMLQPRLAQQQQRRPSNAVLVDLTGEDSEPAITIKAEPSALLHACGASAASAGAAAAAVPAARMLTGLGTLPSAPASAMQTAADDHASTPAQLAATGATAVVLQPHVPTASSKAAQSVGVDPTAAAAAAVPVMPAAASITPRALADAAQPPMPAAAQQPPAAAVATAQPAQPAPPPLAALQQPAAPALPAQPALQQQQPAPPPPPAMQPPAASPGFALEPFSRNDVPGALAQLVLLLDHMAAPDELVERLHASAELLAGLQHPAGQPAACAAQLQLLQVHYATVQLWARRGRFHKAAGVINAMLRGLGA